MPRSIAAMFVNRLWAVPVLALTWMVPVGLTNGWDPTLLAGAFVLAALNAVAGILLRFGGERLIKPLTARA